MIEQVGLGDALPPLPVEQPLDQPLEVPLEPPAATAQQAAEEPVSPGAVAAPPPQPVAARAVEAPVEPDPPPPVAVQNESANVNVSVRIGSAGDGGAVTQANAATAAAPQQYQPEAARYQPAVPDEPPPAQVDQAPAAAAEPAWEWLWAWSCGDAEVAPIAAPAEGLPQNWIWNWDWNCGGGELLEENMRGETGGGYHSHPVQYRPVNINVSIRINSPGNNGPVVQTNVVVAVTVPAPPLQALVAPAAPPLVAPPLEVAAAALDPPAATGGPAAPSEPDDCCLLREPRGVPYAATTSPGALAGDAPTGIASLAGDTVAVAARLELRLRLRRPAEAAAEPPRPQVRPASPAQQRSDNREEPAIVMQSGLGIAPLGGPDRSLPFAALVLLAFLFASANTSLASARSSPARGTDADDPPDRPG